MTTVHHTSEDKWSLLSGYLDVRAGLTERSAKTVRATAVMPQRELIFGIDGILKMQPQICALQSKDLGVMVYCCRSVHRTVFKTSSSEANQKLGWSLPQQRAADAQSACSLITSHVILTDFLCI